MPYFRVDDLEGKDAARLIEAPNAAQAIRYVARRYSATLLRNADLAKMFEGGAKLERAGKEDEATGNG